jgi:integrase
MSRSYGRNVRRRGRRLQTYVQASGQLFTKSWPLTTPRDTLHRWVQKTKRQHPRARSGTFASEAVDYLRAVSAMPSYSDRARDIDRWSVLFGPRSPLSIEPHEIRAALEAWKADGLAAGTLRHRRAALAHFFTVLYPDEPNPVAKVPAPRPPQPEARGLPWAIVERLLAALPDRGRAAKGEKRPAASQTKARLRVIATTGLPHAQLARLTPDDVDWLARRVYVLPRRKGAGTRGRWLPVTPAAIEALRELDRVGAWGPFRHEAMWQSFQRARRTCQGGARQGRDRPPARPAVRSQAQLPVLGVR